MQNFKTNLAKKIKSDNISNKTFSLKSLETLSYWCWGGRSIP